MLESLLAEGSGGRQVQKEDRTLESTPLAQTRDACDGPCKDESKCVAAKHILKVETLGFWKWRQCEIRRILKFLVSVWFLGRQGKTLQGWMYILVPSPHLPIFPLLHFPLLFERLRDKAHICWFPLQMSAKAKPGDKARNSFWVSHEWQEPNYLSHHHHFPGSVLVKNWSNTRAGVKSQVLWCEKWAS